MRIREAPLLTDAIPSRQFRPDCTTASDPTKKLFALERRMVMRYLTGNPYAKEMLTPKWCERCFGCNLGTTVPNRLSGSGHRRR
jgi:hypothetical protein